MKSLERSNFTRTNYNRHLTRIKDRERERIIRDMFNACESKDNGSDLVLVKVKE